MTLFLKQN